MQRFPDTLSASTCPKTGSLTSLEILTKLKPNGSPPPPHPPVYAITVYIHRGKYLVSRYVRAPRPLGEGTWHSLVIEWDRYNLRVSIDSTRVMFDLPAGFWAGGDNRQDGELAGNNLYLGGLPDRYDLEN